MPAPPEADDGRESGFTLLEALVALAIIGLALSALYGVLNLSVEAVVSAQEEALVTERANEIFSGLGVLYPLEEGIQSLPTLRGRHVTLTIRRFHAVSDATGIGVRPALFQVDLTFARAQQNADPIRMHSMRLSLANAPP